MGVKFQVEGKIKRIAEQKAISEKFSVQEFILETGTEQYPNPIKFQTSGKTLGIVKAEMLGVDVVVEFYVNGRATSSGYWNTLNAVSVSLKYQQAPQEYHDHQTTPDGRTPAASEDPLEQDCPF